MSLPVFQSTKIHILCVPQTDLTAVEEATDRLLLLVQREDMRTTEFRLNLVF